MSGGELSRGEKLLCPVVNCSVFPLSGGVPDSGLSSSEYMPGGESPGFPLSGGEISYTRWIFSFLFSFFLVFLSLFDSV